MSDWISVKDCLPASDTNVLYYMPTLQFSKIHIGIYCVKTNTWHDEEGNVWCGPTSHWMPLPDAPKT